MRKLPIDKIKKM